MQTVTQASFFKKKKKIALSPTYRLQGHGGKEMIMLKAWLLITHISLEMTYITFAHILSASIAARLPWSVLSGRDWAGTFSELQGSTFLPCQPATTCYIFQLSYDFNNSQQWWHLLPQRVIKCSFVIQQWSSLNMHVIWDADEFNAIIRYQGMQQIVWETLSLSSLK